jgi:PAS domain S-box-containing protein
VKWVDDRTYIRRNENEEVSHYQGIVMDITDQMLMEAALRESEERFRELAENIRDVFWLFDWSNRQLLYVSPAYEDVWGRPIQNMSNGYREWADSIHRDDAEFVRESFLDIIRTGGGEPRTYRIYRPDGTMRWILDRGFAIRDEDGKVKHIAGVAEDITDQKLAEEELGRHREKLEELIEERTRELAAAQDELLKSERLSVLGQLTATVSHELRNPLGVIRSSLYYLQQKYQGQDAKIKKHMGRIESQVETCNTIVDDLLDFTRGRHSQTVEGEINIWLERVLDEIKESRDIAIRRQLGGKTMRANFDPEKLRRVVINLLENAFQAVRERKRSSGSRSYRPEVEVSSKAVEDGVCLQVRDNGVGMDRQTLQRATEPLFTTKARGTGLGLAVVQKIIDEHGGTVTIQSHFNSGTEVTIRLPGSSESK